MGEFRPMAAYRRSQRSRLQQGLKLATTWRWPTLAQRSQSKLSHMVSALDDSTINIILCIIIIIIILLKKIYAISRPSKDPEG